MRARVIGLLLVLVLSPGCDSPTEPSAISGVLRKPITNLLGRPFGIRVAPNGTIYVTHLDLARVTRISGSNTDDRKVSIVGDMPGDVIITPDASTVIVSTFWGGDVHFINAVTGEAIDVTPIGATADRLLPSASGAVVFVTTTDGKVFAVSAATHEKTDSVFLGGSLQGIARRPDGVIAVSATVGVITLLDPATLDVLDSRVALGEVQDVVFSADGSELFVALESSVGVLVLDGQTLATIDTISFAGDVVVTPFGLAMSPAGDRLVVTSPARANPTGPFPGSLAIVDPVSRTVLQVQVVDGSPRRVAFDPTGLKAYVTNDANRVDVIR